MSLFLQSSQRKHGNNPQLLLHWQLQLPERVDRQQGYSRVDSKVATVCCQVCRGDVAAVSARGGLVPEIGQRPAQKKHDTDIGDQPKNADDHGNVAGIAECFLGGEDVHI